jgi:hypothetical protein
MQPFPSGLAGRLLRWARTADGCVALAAYGTAAGALVLGLLMLAGAVRPERSAYETVRRFYLEASAGEWETARDYLSTGAQVALKIAGADGAALVLPLGGEDGGLIGVIAISVSLEDARTRATVSVALEGPPPQVGAGRTLLDVRREALVRQDGAWVLVCPGRLLCPAP